MGQKNWEIPKLWPDSVVFIIGGGPSLTAMDLSPIHQRRCIGVNQAFELGDWVDICWFGDCRWYDWNWKGLKQFAGLKLTCCLRVPNKGWPGVKQVKRGRSAKGIDPTPTVIAWNGNSGASAINVAYHLGARVIVLLGFDMKMARDNHNWHESHRHTPSDDIYEKRFLPNFKLVASDAKKLGIQILNATPDSALDVFPYISLEDAVKL